MDKKAYPMWNALSEEEKKIVNDIAMQIPLSCEDVAAIYLRYGSSRQKTLIHLYMNYGFVLK